MTHPWGTALSLNQIASQLGTSRASVSQVTSCTSPWETRHSPLPNRHNSPQGSSHSSQPLHGVHRAKHPKYCTPPPKFWCRFVDDTFVIHKEVNKKDFLQHINSVDPAIKFTVEDNKEDGSIPLLDTIVKPEDDGGLSITVYRKPTHTDQYLQWDSHHNLSAKFSVINTLSHRAKSVCSNPELLKQEKEHLRKALTQCKYPKWALYKVEKRLYRSSSEAIDGANNQGTTGTPAATR